MAEAVSGSPTASPGSSTLTQLKSEVAGYVQAPNDTDVLATAERGIKEAIRKMNSRIWEFMLTTEQVTFSAGTADYALNSAFKAPRTFELQNSSGNAQRVLHWKPPKSFSIDHVDRTIQSTASFYTVFNPFDTGQLTLDVLPDSAFVSNYPTGLIRYYARIGFPSASDPVNLPAEYESVITWWAKFYIASVHDPAKSSIALTAWNECLRQAKADDRETKETDYR